MNDPNATRTGPLAGVKILDMSSVLLGPFATMILGDLGADVIKVESSRGSGIPGQVGDIWRHAGQAPVDGMGPLFMALNRNKRGISLDLNTSDGKAKFAELIGWADVFFHNVRMAGMQRLGADYPSVQALKPQIVYVHCAGFGEDGPYGHLSAYDDLIQGISGFTDLTHMRDGGSPGYTPSAIADKTAGLFAVSATIAALYHRERTGEGQFIQVPMFEAFTFFNLVEHLYGQTWDSVDRPMGYTRSINAHRRPYQTRDGYIAIVPYSETQWRTILDIGGYPGLFEDPKFNTYRARTENIGELYQYISKAALTKTTDEWLDILQRADIPAMRCNSMTEVLTDPHLAAAGFFERQTYTGGETYRSMRHPVKYSATPAEIYRHPPRFGEHNEEVFATATSKPAG